MMKTPLAAFIAVSLLGLATRLAVGAPVRLVEEAPVKITTVAPGVVLVDFGRVAFGNLQLIPPVNASGKTVMVHFGEALADGRINRTPPGSVRYAQAAVALDGKKPLTVEPAADKRNTKQPQAVQTPPEFGVVLPFRWVEIEGWPGDLRPEDIRRRSSFAEGWKDDAATFHSSDERLNRIWELCRYSIKATSFAGIYVDGDRERIPYEGDAYLNQLSHYYVEGDVQMARDTFDRLMKYPTWPTEWATHMIFMAHADWMRTGDTQWLAARYAALKTKLHLEQARSDGLIVSSEKGMKMDLVDWPAGERDGFVFKPVNTVINAFHLRALRDMAQLARALKNETDAADYTARERAARTAFHQVFFDPVNGLYRDGEGADHTSLHANLFPLAFGLVPPEHREKVAHWLGKRGMACSVYAAQYLLEGLFENNETGKAIELITAPNDRSWQHMVESGASITWEAWDQHYKKNQDWNHAWGAAPANLLPRFVLGIQPLAPAWNRAIIRPNPGPLLYAEGKIPTPLGSVLVHWENGNAFRLSLTLPRGMSARIQLPAGKNSQDVIVNGKPVAAHRDGPWWIVDKEVTGTAVIETR